MRRYSFLLNSLFVSLAFCSVAPAPAEPLIETLDPGPMPVRTAPKPVALDWRQDRYSDAAIARSVPIRHELGPSTAGLRTRQAARAPILPPPEAEQAVRRAYERSLVTKRRARLAYGKRGGRGFSIQSIQDPPPQAEFLSVKATPIYLRTWTLQARHEYLLETRGLSTGGDTVLYLLRDGRQVASNDDRAAGDYSSSVRYTPPETADYTVLIRAYDDAGAGTCDLYVDGERVEQRLQFGGSVVRWDWQPGDQFQTAHLPSTYARAVDTVLFAFDDMKLVGWNDNGGINGCSRLTMARAPAGRTSHILVGSRSQEPAEADWVMLYRNALSGGDSDGDGLADSLERSLGTDPNAVDTDGDGLRDDWEVFGVHTPAGDEDLPADAGIGINSRKGSDPRVKDLFLEIDWMAGPGGESDLYRPLDASLEFITRQFWESGGVALHVDLGQMGSQPSRGGQLLPYQEVFDRTGTWPLSLEACFGSGNWLAPCRRHLFAYMVCASRFPDRSSSGHMVRMNEDGTVNEDRLFYTPLCPAAIVSMDSGINGSLSLEASAIMHEFGHCLNLQHGGFESYVNLKPNYLSCMNYLYEFGGLGDDGTPDYSHGGRAPLDERAMDELAGVGPVSDHVNWLIRKGRSQPSIPRRDDVRSAVTPLAIDWNGDGRISAVPVAVDFNGDGRYTVLRDFDDWSEVRRPQGGTSWVGVNAGVEGWSSGDDQP